MGLCVGSLQLPYRMFLKYIMKYRLPDNFDHDDKIYQDWESLCPTSNPDASQGQIDILAWVESDLASFTHDEIED